MVNKFWEIFDFSSKEAKLHIQGKPRYKTKFGAFMSIMSLISTCILSLYFFVVYFQKNDGWNCNKDNIEDYFESWLSDLDLEDLKKIIN